jgi:hypothetical protein
MPAVQRQEPVASAGFVVTQFQESVNRSAGQPLLT